ncbi:MAG TPA: cytochrome ubiquinol oxidase subunit I, partial [Thermodesulfobacteriota bacterium]
IVYHHMKVEDAATGNTGIWIMTVSVMALYPALGVTTIVVLRAMSRRFRRAGGFAELETPYGPDAPDEPAPAEMKETVR